MEEIYWQDYFKNYPQSTIQDFIKFLYQATLGSGHLILNISDNYQYLRDEYHHLKHDPNHPLYEKISSNLLRVHLEAIEEIDLYSYHQLFIKSVEMKDINQLKYILNSMEQKVKEGLIPFDIEKWHLEVNDYLQQDCPILSHSSLFKELYHPHYRLMNQKYLLIINLLHQINRLNRPIISIDGLCGSGKSTLANFLSDIYHLPIIHLDDFFLQSYQRNPKRLNEIGGNVDYERFYNEVITSLNKNSLTYQIFDCQKMALSSYQTIDLDKGVIIEGSYAHHPYFHDYADIQVFLDVDKDIQEKRILDRNGDKMLQRFIHEWIPKELAYFEKFHIQDKAMFHFSNLQF